TGAAACDRAIPARRIPGTARSKSPDLSVVRYRPLSPPSRSRLRDDVADLATRRETAELRRGAGTECHSGHGALSRESPRRRVGGLEFGVRNSTQASRLPLGSRDARNWPARRYRRSKIKGRGTVTQGTSPLHHPANIDPIQAFQQ